MDSKRCKELINNILSDICNVTDIPKGQYIPWLKSEVGMTESEIKELKTEGLLPMPIN